MRIFIYFFFGCHVFHFLFFEMFNLMWKMYYCFNNYVFGFDGIGSCTEPPLLGPGGTTFTPYGPPEYHQNTSDVGASTNTPTGWKPSPVHPALMKDPPSTGRMVQQGQQQGAVMMVYGLDKDTSNTDKLFNLVCLYGNVARVSQMLNIKIDRNRSYGYFI